MFRFGRDRAEPTSDGIPTAETEITSTRRLREILRELSSWGAIDYTRRGISSAGLNVHAYSGVEKLVPELTRNLYRKVADSGIDYDAVTSCPRGGDAWAQALAAKAQANGKNVSFYRLGKDGRGRFSIIDGQPIKPGAKLILADDTLYMGYTSISAVKLLEDAGFKVVGFVFPVEIGNVGRSHWEERRRPIFSVYNSQTIGSYC